MKKHFEKNNFKNGFSLIEVIISIGIISVGIVSIINLFSSVLKNEIANKNKLIAIYLAEENIEIVRQLRDNNWLEGKDWDSFHGSDTKRIVSLKSCNDESCDLNDGWQIRNAGASGTSRKIFYDIEEKYYGQKDPITGTVNKPTNWRETGFKRWLTMSDKTDIDGNSNNNALKVTSEVSHNEKTLVKITTYLYNWK